MVAELTQRVRLLELDLQDRGGGGSALAASPLRIARRPVLEPEPDHSPRRRDPQPLTPPPAEILRGEAQHVFVFFDLETGGLGKTKDIRICQIAAQAVDEHLRVLGEWNSFCNPLQTISPSAIKVHGFDNDFVQGYTDWGTVGVAFNAFLERMRHRNPKVPLTLCAHNGNRFDVRILIFHHNRHGIDFPNNVLYCDTIPVFKTIFPGLASYSLGSVYANAFGTEVPNAHDAVADVQAMVDLCRHGEHENKTSILPILLNSSKSINLKIKDMFKQKQQQ